MKLEQILMRTSFLQMTFIGAAAAVLVGAVLGSVIFLCWCISKL